MILLSNRTCMHLTKSCSTYYNSSLQISSTWLWYVHVPVCRCSWTWFQCVYCIHFQNQIVFIPAKINSVHGSNITKFRHGYKQYTVATITYMQCHSIINNFIFHEATVTMATSAMIIYFCLMKSQVSDLSHLLSSIWHGLSLQYPCTLMYSVRIIFQVVSPVFLIM